MRAALILALLACLHARIDGPVVTLNVTENDVVSDVVTVKAQASSDNGITKVEFSVDDQIRATQAKPPFEYKWDTVDEEEGSHRLIVSAYDGAGKAVAKRIKVEVDNGLSLGVKPHAAKAMALYRQGEFERAALEGRKAYRINIADREAIRGLALSVGLPEKGDLNRAIDLLEKQQVINNQAIGDAKMYPLSDADSLEVRAYFRLLRAAKQTAAGPMIADLSTVYDFWRKLAEARLAAVRAQTADSPAAQIALGDALLDHDDYADALAAYEKVSPGAPEATVSKNRVALALIAQNRLAEAEQRLTRMAVSGSRSDATHALLGAVYLRQFRVEQARKEVEESANHGSLSALLIRAYVDMAGRNFGRAFDSLKQLAQRAPGPESAFLAANLFTDTGDLKRATAFLFESLRVRPADLDAYSLRGYQLAAMDANGFPMALAIWDFILQRRPDHSGAQIGKTIALVQMKRPKAAEELVKTLQREQRYAADAWMAVAAADAAGTDQKGATEALAAARKLEPQKFPYIYVPPMPELARAAAHYRQTPLITPTLLSLEEGPKRTAMQNEK